MKLPRDLSGEEVAGLLARHYGAMKGELIDRELAGAS